MADYHITIYADGACARHQDEETRRSSYGYIILNGGETIHEDSGYLDYGPTATNHRAGYDAVRLAVDYVSEQYEPGLTQLVIITDCEPAVNQIPGEWKTKEPTLRPKRDALREAFAFFESYDLKWEQPTNSDLIRHVNAIAKNPEKSP